MARPPKNTDLVLHRIRPGFEPRLVRTGPTTGAPDLIVADYYLEDGTLAVEAMVAVAEGGQARLVHMEVSPGPRAHGPHLPAITTSMLRRILVDQIVKTAVAEATVDMPPEEPERVSRTTVADQAETAAKHYLEATRTGSRAPTEAVALAMGVSRAQASRYVRAARDQGLIPGG